MFFQCLRLYFVDFNLTICIEDEDLYHFLMIDKAIFNACLYKLTCVSEVSVYQLVYNCAELARLPLLCCDMSICIVGERAKRARHY